jgi:glycosyltransferase involved in cell wall biosynthesis
MSSVRAADDASGIAAPSRSLIIPVYLNELNIPPLLVALTELHRTLDGDLEVVFVIDGSPDASGEVLARAQAGLSFPSRIVFHSRNFGSFTAIRTGLEHASGRLFAVMAADLQEPPELIARFFATLEADECDIVFGQRVKRNDAPLRDALSRTFWWLYRKLVISGVPRGGVDIFACNLAAREELLAIEEPNSSLIAQLFWIGFRRSFVTYERRPREIGTSAWGVGRRLRYMMDSIFSFTDLPLILVLWVGVIGVLISLVFGIGVAIARLTGEITEPGYTTLALLITFFGSAILAVQGIIGSYLWRTFENTKRRPLRIVARIVDGGGKEL